MADLTLTAAQIAPVFPLNSLDETYDMVAGVSITAGQAIRQNTSSGKAALADANAGSGAEKAIGLSLNAAGAGQGVSFIQRGKVYGFDLSGLAYGALVYLSDTAGALADAPSTTNSVPVGRVVALSNSDLTKVLELDFPIVPPAFNGVFVSSEQTGTGSSQNVAHGLGVVPNKVLIAVTELPDAAAETGFDIAEGAHTSTNVVVTVTNTVKFKVLAFA
jgi:hypothetical protein